MVDWWLVAEFEFDCSFVGIEFAVVVVSVC